MNTWQRYFYREMGRTVLVLLVSFYGLYVLVDAMTHLHMLRHGMVAFQYYLAMLSKRLDVLLPFAILLAVIRCLLGFQQRGELVALLASGISRHRLMQPFLVVALISAGVVLLNYEFGLPRAAEQLRLLKQARSQEADDDEATPPLHEVWLQDGTKLLYSHYDIANAQLQDVFWLKSPDELFHAKTLSTTSTTGIYVDRIVRTPSGGFAKEASWEHYTLPVPFDPASLETSIHPPVEQPVSQLIRELSVSRAHSTRAAGVQVSLWYKLLFPLLCVVACIGPMPWCLRFTRYHSVLLIYLVGIATLFCLNVLLQAAWVVGNSQLIPPLLAIGVPWLLIGTFVGRRYAYGQ